MGSSPSSQIPLFLLSLSLLFFSALSDHGLRQVYIVYLGEHQGAKTPQEIIGDHHNFLLSVKNSEEEARESVLYNYKNSINGFAALLTDDEARKLSAMEGVVSVFPSQATRWSTHTTRSWEFLAEEEDLIKTEKYELLTKSRFGKDIIVGLLDSGLWPESKSFGDKLMGPVPKRWKGICEEGDAFSSSNCNRKLIGARYYLKGYEANYGPLNTSYAFRSPRDHDGHGTHTSSTIGGQIVHGVSALGGFAYGTVAGGAPLAQLAMYKVCWPTPGPNPNLQSTCFNEDMMAAMDDAIGDGVDVISISIGAFNGPPSYVNDPIAIGALHAVKRNIVVACSAGNDGPAPSTVVNVAPWIITVGASTIDRRFPAPVVLGNEQEIQGHTLTPHELSRRQYPLVYAGDAEVPGIAKNLTGQCLPESLSPEKVEGRIVLCFRGNGTRFGKGIEVKRAGGAGFILGNSPAFGNDVPFDPHVLPATAVASKEAAAIFRYIKSARYPTAMLVRAKTILDTKPSPVMAAFSSQGPNLIEPSILKPDITAPGVNILAAWSEASSPTKLSDDHRSVKYNLLSGTSMSCPHVAATAALLKSIHPRWSSAAIRSAMMTTASLHNNMGQPITNMSGYVAGPFELGSGHLRPTHASDPGLVFDATYKDYLLFTCSSVKAQMDPSFPCPTNPPSPADLNYASVVVSKLNGAVVVKRTVTNVGRINGPYHVAVSPPVGVTVDISPKLLEFKGQGEKKSFFIKVEANKRFETSSGEYSFGSYTWSDGSYSVRSPIVVSFA